MSGKQNVLLVSLASGSLLFAYTVYLCGLFSAGDAYMSWLLLASASGAGLLFIGMGPPGRSWNLRTVPALLFVLLNSVSTGLGMWYAADSSMWGAPVLTAVGWLLLVLAAVNVYRVAFGAAEQSASPAGGKVLHAVNVSVGLLLVSGTFQFGYDYYLFSEDGTGAVWLLAVPLLLFGVTYGVQASLLGRRKSVVLSLGVLQLLLPAVLYFIWKSVSAGEGWV